MSAEDEDRAFLRGAIGGVTFNVRNFPERVQSRLLGQDMSQLNAKLIDAVIDAGFRLPRPRTNDAEWDAEFEALATKEAENRILGASGFARDMRKQLVEMAVWAQGISEVHAWAEGR